MRDEDAPSALHFFVDEAGDPSLFDSKGRILVGEEGCSNYFILGKLDVDDPPALAAALETLRARLLADPYFKRVPSMQLERRKTALGFHAKDDVAEVRREVFNILLRADVRFYAVVRRKVDLLAYVKQRNALDQTYRYKGDELYDTLVEELFRRYHPFADQLNICFARRGNKTRTHAFRSAIEPKRVSSASTAHAVRSRSGSLQARLPKVPVCRRWTTFCGHCSATTSATKTATWS